MSPTSHGDGDSCSQVACVDQNDILAVSCSLSPRFHLLVDLDGKLLAWDHHRVLWLHPEHFRPTPGRHICSISSFYSMGIFAGRGCAVSKIWFFIGIPQWDSHRVGLLGQKLPEGVSGA